MAQIIILVYMLLRDPTDPCHFRETIAPFSALTLKLSSDCIKSLDSEGFLINDSLRLLSRFNFYLSDVYWFRCSVFLRSMLTRDGTVLPSC